MRFFGSVHVDLPTYMSLPEWKSIVSYIDTITNYIKENKIEHVYFESERSTSCAVGLNLFDGRIEQIIREAFPNITIHYLDNDIVRKKGDLEDKMTAYLYSILGESFKKEVYDIYAEIADDIERVYLEKGFKIFSNGDNTSFENIMNIVEEYSMRAMEYYADTVVCVDCVSRKIKGELSKRGYRRDTLWPTEFPEKSIIIAGMAHVDWFNSLKK